MKSQKSALEMIHRARGAVTEYPPQFWILFGGMLVNAAGSSLIFPFFTLYVRQRFDVPMTTIGVAMAVMAGLGLVSGALGGALADRFGRKTLMVGGLTLAALSSFTMGLVDSLAAFFAVAIFVNLVFPLSRRPLKLWLRIW